MSASNLSSRRILILATDGFEQSELEVPQKELAALGATVHVAAPKTGAIKGWNHTDWGNEIQVDLALSDADAKDYDALVLPGGQMNPDALRMEPDAIALIKAFAAAGKPVAAVCHAPWLLIDAGLVNGRKVTSWPSVRTDLKNAGGHRRRRIRGDRPRHHHQPQSGRPARLRRGHRLSTSVSHPPGAAAAAVTEPA